MNPRFLVFLGLLLPLALCAQNTSAEKELKPLFGKSSRNSSDKSSKEKPAAKDLSRYLTGAVPLVDGRVVFKAEFPSEMPKQEMFDAVREWASQRFVPAPRTLATEPTDAKVLSANPVSGKIVCVGDEYMVFTNKILNLDQTRVHYLLTLVCKDRLCEATLSKISYDYQTTGEENVYSRIPAEEQITDKYALRSKNTKLVHETGTKFRVHTIDLKDTLFNEIKSTVE